MKKCFFIYVAMLCTAVLPTVAQPRGGTPEKLPIDASVRVGRLDNGMRYYIKHHAKPAARADFFIAHNVGALQEDDNQNGLAHFLEHMAFNGTKNFPDKNLLNYLASIGVRFGYNVNAYTSRERTVYNVSNVPLTRDGIVDSLLLIMHDWSYYITCDPQEIEDERGVIREEWRRGDDSRSRMARMTSAVEFGDSKYAKRDVIGDPEIINTFKPETLVDFYHKWYRPDMQAIIVVGDVDLDKMEAKIKKVMSTIPKAKNPAPKEDYTIPITTKPRYAVLADPEIKAVGIKLIYRQGYPTAAERATTAPLRNNMVRGLFLEAMRSRFTEFEKQPDAGYKKVVAVCGVTVSSFNTFQMTAMPKGMDIAGSLRSMFYNVEQARRYGFTQAEFEAAKTRVERAERQSLDKLRQATNTDWASTIIDHFTHNVTYTTVEERERISEEMLASLTLADLNAMKDLMIQEQTLLIIPAIPEDKRAEMPTEAEVMAMLDEARNADIAPLADAAQGDKPIFTKQVTPGKVVKSEKWEYNSELWTLANGVKVYWRTTPEVVGMRKFGMVAVNQGGFNRDADGEALRIVENYTRWVGVNDMDRNAVRDYQMDHSMLLNLSLTKTFSTIKGSTTLENAEKMLQLTHLYMTNANFSDAAYGKFVAQFREQLEKGGSPKGFYADSSARAKYGNDHPWLHKVSLATLDRIDAKSAEKIYKKQFGNAAEFVFFFSGEMTAQEARPLIEKYIGSLPTTTPEKCTVKRMNILPGEIDYEYLTKGSQTPKSEIERVYHASFDYTPANYATLRYVTYILGARYMKSVREEKGGTYYIGVKDEVDALPEGRCQLIVNFDTDPNLRTMLLEEVQKGFANLAATAPTEQEVTEARLYFQKANTEKGELNVKSVQYWLQKMESKYTTGVDLEKENTELFSAVTPQQIQKLAHSIFSQGNRFTMIFTQQQ